MKQPWQNTPLNLKARASCKITQKVCWTLKPSQWSLLPKLSRSSHCRPSPMPDQLPGGPGQLLAFGKACHPNSCMRRAPGTWAARSEKSFVPAPAAVAQPRFGVDQSGFSPFPLPVAGAPPAPSHPVPPPEARPASPCPGGVQGRPGQSPCRGRGWAGPQPHLALHALPRWRRGPWGSARPSRATSPERGAPGRPRALSQQQDARSSPGQPRGESRGCGSRAKAQLEQRSVARECVSGTF